MSFLDCLNRTLKLEGGYSDNPADRGGATNYGITQKTFDEHGGGGVDVRFIRPSQVEKIYFEVYWVPARAEMFPAIEDLHFDAAVNHGVMRAIKFLQEAVGVAADGKLGPVTVGAYELADKSLVRARYMIARYRFYGAIAARDRTQRIFLTGWLSRLAEFPA